MVGERQVYSYRCGVFADKIATVDYLCLYKVH